MPDAPPWTPSEIRSLRRAVLGFFRRSARSLPWRGSRDWYPVLVSELMLQQTRAQAVVPYFSRWMERFPTPETLASADPEDVLATWQGLGYYARARHLQAAVREVVHGRGGSVPETPEGLRALPGIGPYTAGAVASIAFGRAVPAVDGNVRRVLARLTDTPDPSPATLRSWAGALVDPVDPGSFNQGLMELGARVCAPRAPACESCPIRRHCLAAERGTASSRPVPKPKPRPREVHEVVLVLFSGRRGSERVLFRRRPDRGLLGGMWELPGTQVAGGEAPEAVVAEMARRWAPRARLISRLPRLDHAFTHRRVAYLPFLFRAEGRGRGSPSETSLARFRWAELQSEVGAMPLPAAQRKIIHVAFGPTGD